MNIKHMSFSARNAVSILLAAIASSTYAGQVLGVGNSPCSEYALIAKSDAPKLVSNYVGWVHGYLTGANIILLGINPNFDLLSRTTPQAISERLRKVCMKNENANVTLQAVAMGILTELQSNLQNGR
jgi:hypothetical protein